LIEREGRMLRLGVLLVLASVLLATFVSAASGARTTTEQKSYTAGLDVLIVDCENGVGGVCFDVAGNATTAWVTFDDASGQPVGGIYEFRNADDDTLSSNVFCGSFTAAVPDGATRLLVFLAAATGPVDCLENGGTGVATTGTATATFALKGTTKEKLVYELPRWFEWDRAALDVLIVPPEHGQLVNGNGFLGGSGDPNELDPFKNSYTRAIEDSIAAWTNGIAQFGASWLVEGVSFDVYVVGRDQIPQEALEQPEIVIMTDQTKGPILGFALSSDPCLVNNSKFFVTSMTYEDMYNINGQEFGHCLGLLHTSDGRPDHDVMDGTYDDSPGAAGTHLHCVSNLDVLGLEQVFGALFGQPTEEVVSVVPREYTTIPCSAQNPRGAPG
jgi:hypothetical protein